MHKAVYMSRWYRKIVRQGVLILAIIALVHCRGARSAASQEVPAALPAKAARDLQILVVTDTHLDPFRNRSLAQALARAPFAQWPPLLTHDIQAPLPNVGRDTNPALLFSALRAMEREVPHPDAIFVVGDLLGHHFRESYMATVDHKDDASYHMFVDNSADLLAHALHRLYPQAQILPTVGNNDGYCGDYRSTPRDQFLAHQAATWEPLVNLHERAASFRQTYASGGYYEARLANGVRVLDLNSIVFSDGYENACGDPAAHPADEQLSWLNSRLQSSPKIPTLLLTHIPPGIDAFKTFLQLGNPVSFYQADIQTRLMRILDQPQASIQAMITGHLHNIGYRVFPDGANGGIAVYSAPSISPIFGNAPAFAEVAINAQGGIDNVTVFALNSSLLGLRMHPDWHRAYDVRQRYGMAGLTVKSIKQLHHDEQVDLSLRDLMIRDRVSGGPAGAIGNLSWRTAWCAEIAVDPTAYLNCEGVQAAPRSP